jgi:hypothetical protein
MVLNIIALKKLKKREHKLILNWYRLINIQLINTIILNKLLKNFNNIIAEIAFGGN